VAVILDSDAVIGFLDRGDTLHASANATIRELILEQRLYISVVTYAEVLTGARLGHHDEGRVRGFFNELISRILPVDLEVADKAAGLRSQRKVLRMPDALILATAETNGEIDLIVTGDSKATKIPGLRCQVELLGYAEL
jgi:predicted nucleic acid-binding protein